MGGKASREKGKRGEREIATVFRDALHVDAMRGWQARKGSDAPDVIVPHLWIESKRAKRCNPWTALAQAILESTRNTVNGNDPRDAIPVAITQADRQPKIATMLLSDLVLLLKLSGYPEWERAHVE